MSGKNEQEIAGKEQQEKNRYDIVVESAMWAKERRKEDKYKNEPASKVIQDALEDVLSGKVTREQVLQKCADNHAKELKALEEARLEAERKAKEPMKL